MKMLTFVTIVAISLAVPAKAVITADFSETIDNVERVAFGAAVGYVAKKQLAFWNRTAVDADASTKTSNAVQAATLAGLAGIAGYLALGGKCTSKCFYVASLAAITTFVATQSAEEEDDLAQAYAAATAEAKKRK